MKTTYFNTTMNEVKAYGHRIFYVDKDNLTKDEYKQIVIEAVKKNSSVFPNVNYDGFTQEEYKELALIAVKNGCSLTDINPSLLPKGAYIDIILAYMCKMNYNLENVKEWELPRAAYVELAVAYIRDKLAYQCIEATKQPGQSVSEQDNQGVLEGPGKIKRIT